MKTLWPETIKYLNQGDNYKYINPKGSFQWLLEDLQNPKKQNLLEVIQLVIFWSNFEIGDFDFSVMKLMIIGLNILILQGNFIMNDGVMHQYIQLELVYLLIKIKFIF